MSVGKFFGLIDAMAAIMLFFAEFSSPMERLKYIVIAVLLYKALISWA